MKLLFTEKAEKLNGKILIELFNSLSEKFPEDVKVSINRVYPVEEIDKLNSRQRIHVQLIGTSHGHHKHFLFDMKYGNDFSCANIYLTECHENPAIAELALNWVQRNYDVTGISGDLVNAFVSGYKAGSK